MKYIRNLRLIVQMKKLLHVKKKRRKYPVDKMGESRMLKKAWNYEPTWYRNIERPRRHW
jgi:hypothetical protein